MPKSLPVSPNLEQLKKQSRELLSSLQAQEPEAMARAIPWLKPSADTTSTTSAPALHLTDAQLVLAREYGFLSWAKLKAHVDSMTQLKDSLHQQLLDEAFIRMLHKEKNLPRARQLLENGANINGRLVGPGTTALSWAACGGDVGLMRFLIEAGADVNMPAAAGHPALSSAAHFGHHEAVELLLSQGAQVNIPTPGNYTPLHEGSYSRSEKVVRLLLRAGAHVNAQTAEGQFGEYWFALPYCGETPLHNAMAHGSQTIIEMLLDAGADASLTTRHGETPFQWAGRFEKHRTKQFMRWLRSVKANLEKTM